MKYYNWKMLEFERDKKNTQIYAVYRVVVLLSLWKQNKTMLHMQFKLLYNNY